MNVACTACPAKYAVSDEKVRGKRARITCKHCGAHILVDGTQLGKVAPSLDGATKASARAPRVVRNTLVFLSSPAAAAVAPESPSSAEPEGSEKPWLIAFSEQRQEHQTTEQLLDLYGRGTIDADTYIWREGMTEWKTAFEIPELSEAMQGRGYGPYPIATQPLFRQADASPMPSTSDAIDAEALALQSRGPADWALNGAAAEYDAAPSPTAPLVVGSSPYTEAASRDAEDLITRAGHTLPGAISQHAFDDSDGLTIAREPSRPSNAIGLPAFEQLAPVSRPFSPVSAVSAPSSGAAEQPGMAAEPSSSRPASQRAARRPERLQRRTTLDDLFGSAGSGAEVDGSEKTTHQARASEVDWREAGPAGFAGSDAGPRAPTFSNPSSSLDSRHLVGARNESSVLFSLDALVSADRRDASTGDSQTTESELLLGSNARSDAPLAAGFNLGAFASPMAAPDYMAPVRAMPEPDLISRSSAPMAVPFAPAARRGRSALVAVLVFGAGIATAMALGLPSRFNPPPAPAPVLQTTQAAAPAQAAPVAVAPEGAPEAEARPDGPTSATPSALTAAPSAAPAMASAARRSSARDASNEPASNAEVATARKTVGIATAAPQASETSGSAAAFPPADVTEPAVEAPEFDRGAAVEVLGAAAANARSCKQADGPTGNGQVTVTFAASGRVTTASVSGDLAGSNVGSCVAKLFRAARVPAFSGEPVTVAKRFAIE